MSVMEIERDTTEEDFDLDLRDELFDLSADLVAMRSHEDFLQRLFAQEPGDWENLVLLYRGLPQMERRLQRLQEALVSPLFITWLAHPDSSENDNYCTIIFFATDLLWSNVIVYNKQRLLASINHHGVNGRP